MLITSGQIPAPRVEAPVRNARQKKFTMTMRKKVFFKGKDFGWLFSQRLGERLILRTGMTAAEIDVLLATIGAEYRQLLMEGHAVGFPGCPVVYARRRNRMVHCFNSGKRKLLTHVARTFVYTSSPYRREMQETLVDRGDVRSQYDRERTRLSGDSRLAFRPRKKTAARSLRP